MVSDPGFRFVRTEKNLLRRELVLSSLQVLGISSVLFHCCVELTVLYPFGAIYPPGDNHPLQDKCRGRALLNIHARILTQVVTCKMSVPPLTSLWKGFPFAKDPFGVIASSISPRR